MDGHMRLDGECIQPRAERRRRRRRERVLTIGLGGDGSLLQIIACVNRS